MPSIKVPFKVSSIVKEGGTTFAIATDGKLYTWGSNDYGQVGNGSTSAQTTPYEVTSVGKVNSLETYGSTVYAITEEGKLYAWGYNGYGEVGNGSTGTQTTPYELTSVGKVKSLEVNYDYSYGSTVYAITEDNRLYAWGDNEYGEVGNGESGSNTKQLTPYEVTEVGKVKSLEVYDIVDGATVYAITEEGKLYAWGYNSSGQVGNGSTSKQTTPYELTSVGKVKSLEVNYNSSHGSTVYAITEDNRLYAWGYNGYGQVGNGSTGTQTTPYEVTSVGKVNSLETYGSTVYAITEDGKLYAWGDNYYGQVGNGAGYTNQTTPYEVTSVGKVKSIEIYGTTTVYAITEDGRLYAWGFNEYGQVGNGGRYTNQTTPYEVTSVGKVNSLETYGSTVYAITEEGKLYAWGSNSSGQVGNGSTGTQTTPYELTSIVGKVRSIETEDSTVYAITEDGRLYAWGGNSSNISSSNGLVGNGERYTNQTTPYELTSIVGKVKSVVCSDFLYSTVYAITEEGKLYAWGSNTYGEVGNGFTGTQTTPYEVTSVGKVKSLEIDGYNTVYVITEDNRLYSWGDNEYGEVGNGSTETQTTPYYISEVKQFLE